MKKLLTLAAVLFFVSAQAQLKIPRPSAPATVEQTIGYTTLKISYSRPTKSGRIIFGDLVPFGEKWRTGADKNTMITTNNNLTINGKTLPKGTYALYAEPYSERWVIYFYKNIESWGLPNKWNDADVVLKTEVKPTTNNTDTEAFTIDISPVSVDAGVIEIRWEKTSARIPFQTETIAQVTENIAKNLTPTSSSDDYYDAALFLLNAKKDYDKALAYINTSIEKDGEAPHYSLWLKARILNALGKRKEAIQNAEASLKKAQKLGNKSYIRLNERLLQEWR
ncbi:MAG: DUF2911 domain-containing protein [Capnocytophaga sp.]|nr:DUF2911 domain-containing protein [Capnocytophaga sp.]